ncbi:hypothetical protein BGZ70_002999 [Mortierella alpina]|uniref:Uncharacterized protein n=1 Tax=Mortierella alpina TaxID=64518 RepID=A0A9P6IT44_MORAP|nr:hypothetical protein BGZ70_002999 [Mortierella alpina]
MGTRSQPIAGSGPSSLAHHNPHRSSLRTTAQLRWPVNLNQLAAISLDDDSDIDRSLTDISRDDIGSVKLLRMLKDSDDESPIASRTGSRLRRPRSTYATMQSAQQNQLQLQKPGLPITRSSSLHNVPDAQSKAGTSIPKPLRARSDQKMISGTAAAASTTGTGRRPGLRHHQSDMSLMMGAGKAQSKTMGEVQGVSSSEAALASHRPSGARSSALIGQSGSTGKTLAGNSTTTMLRKPTASSSLSSSSSSLPASGTLQQSQSHLNATAPKRPTSSSTSTNGRHSAMPTSSATGSRQETQRSQDQVLTPIPTLVHEASRATNQQQQQGAAVPTGPASGGGEHENNLIRELNEELERWRAEAQDHQQERARVDGWRKQISDLERDLETALESLQAAEAKVIEANAEQNARGSQISQYEQTIDRLRTNHEAEKAEKEKREKSLEQETLNQKRKLGDLESRNQDLETKLTQAQQEIEQLELQVVPAELQDVHQALFSATQDLEEANRLKDKLKTELAEEKAKIIREQEDSGQLLVKLSQLQDTIANQQIDINALRDIVREHESCQEKAETAEYQHKKALELLQRDVVNHQQTLAQEKEQKSAIEQSLQEQQCQIQPLQQQLQMQQTQLVQQQTEIVNLRASLEVEQNQASLLQQRLQEEQRLNNPHFGRRVSLDGELNGSYLMIETSRGVGGAAPVSNADANAMAAMAAMSGHAHTGSGPGPLSPVSSSSMLTNQIASSTTHMAAPSASLPPSSTNSTTSFASGGGMVGPASVVATQEVEVKPRMIQRGSSGSIPGVLSSSFGSSGYSNHHHNNSIGGKRLSMHGDMFGSFTGAMSGAGAGTGVGGAGAGAGASGAPSQSTSIEELMVQLQGLMKEKERLQADLSKIPISGGGPMTRRKAEMLEEQMDETEKAMSKIRYSIRMRS